MPILIWIAVIACMLETTTGQPRNRKELLGQGD
jgi:hypothetical protein